MKSPFRFNKMTIVSILTAPSSQKLLGDTLKVNGWVKSIRKQGAGKIVFVAVNDGSCVRNLQVVVCSNVDGFSFIKDCHTGCSMEFTGKLVSSPGGKQTVEMLLDNGDSHAVKLLGGCNSTRYPLCKAKQSREFLRENLHLRCRSYTIGCATRIRSQLVMATHKFFQDLGFICVATPIITSTDCEGAGNMFRVSYGRKQGNQHCPNGITDIYHSKAEKEAFFGQPTFLTVSGQLTLEAFCCGMGDVYAFGPTFRAEMSHTNRHLSEFWMLEAEIAFCSFSDVMDCAEAYLKHCIDWALLNCSDEIDWLTDKIDEGLKQRLIQLQRSDYTRISYGDAVELLSGLNVQFCTKPSWGVDLATEHEKYLTEHFMGPVIVYDYPKTCKAFYMKQNEDNMTVQAMDLLVPKIGEIIGGSQREEIADNLRRTMEERGMDPREYQWYIDLREYGTIRHGGFGLGFERLIMLVTGLDNVRDVIPFPRYPGHATC